MKSSYFVFEKDGQTVTDFYQLTTQKNTRSELEKHLNSRLQDGFDAKDFFIIYGKRKEITAVKVVAEFETLDIPPNGQPIR